MCEKITQTHEFYKEQLSRYPKCRKYIKIYHPDLQGPFDIAHLIWGSDIYMALYDDEDLFHEFMSLITDTYIAYMDKILDEIEVDYDGYEYHWGTLYKGRILVRDDSSVNLSRQMYLDHIHPYFEKIAQHYSGIGVHFCGRADQWVEDLINTPGVDCVNFGYMPEKFDNSFLKTIHGVCAETKTAVVNYVMSEKEFASFDSSIFSTGLSLAVNTENLETARKIKKKGL